MVKSHYLSVFGTIVSTNKEIALTGAAI